MKTSQDIWIVLAILTGVVVMMWAIHRSSILKARNSEAIFDAFKAHNYAQVIALLNSGVDPNSSVTPDYERRTPREFFEDLFGKLREETPDRLYILNLACLYCSLEVCQALLERGADANRASRIGVTPLCSAVVGMERPDSPDGIKIIELLLKYHAKVNGVGKYRSLALPSAAGKGSEYVTKLLIDNGADVNKIGLGGLSSLYNAADGGHLSIVKMLLDAGADPTLPTTHGKLPVNAARYRRNPEIVAMLEDAMAKRKAAATGGPKK
ncbi:MAG: ankyrin repeat domain-containing protein [Chthonomonadales bacterium]